LILKYHPLLEEIYTYLLLQLYQIIYHHHANYIFLFFYINFFVCYDAAWRSQGAYWPAEYAALSTRR